MAHNDYVPFNGLRGKPLEEVELKILWLYGHNDTPAKIAERLEITISTVVTYLKYARCKLGSYTSWCAYEKAKRLMLFRILSKSSNPKFRIDFPPPLKLHS